MGLDGSTCSESFPGGNCHFEPPEHVPRTSARAQTYARGPGGLPACHGAENTRKDPRPEEKKVPKCQKKHLYMVIYIYIIFMNFLTLNTTDMFFFRFQLSVETVAALNDGVTVTARLYSPPSASVGRRISRPSCLCFSHQPFFGSRYVFPYQLDVFTSSLFYDSWPMSPYSTVHLDTTTLP